MLTCKFLLDLAVEEHKDRLKIMNEPICLKKVCDDLITAGYYASMLGGGGGLIILTSAHNRDTEQGYSKYTVEYYCKNPNIYSLESIKRNRNKISIYYQSEYNKAKSEASFDRSGPVSLSSSGELIQLLLDNKVKKKNELITEIKRFEERKKLRVCWI